MEIPNSIKKIVIDGANVVQFTHNRNDEPEIKNLIPLFKWLEEVNVQHRIQIEIIVDSTLRRVIDKKDQYEYLLRYGVLKQVPATTTADAFIVKMVEKYQKEILVISNDLFRDFSELKADTSRIQYGFMILFDSFELIPLKFSLRNKRSRKKNQKLSPRTLISEINQEISNNL